MSECIIDVSTNIFSILQLSGKSFQYIGQYDDCISSSAMNYNMVNIRFKGQSSEMGFIGLCLPKTCTKQIITQTIDQFMVSIHYPFQVSTINNNVQEYHYDFIWVFYVCVLISLISLFLIIYTTVINTTNNKLHKIFSINTNKNIFHYNQNSNLNVLNGVRSIAMMWVVIGHVYTNLLGGTINMSSSVEKNSFEQPFFLLIQAGLFSVDVFFFIGGLLVAYVMLKKNDKLQSNVKYPLAILNRVLRMWPSYIFAMLIYYSVYLHLGTGPKWASDQSIVKYCDNMWKSIFFVDNLVNNGETPCMGWGWYIQNDMQLFIASIILLYVYKLKPIVSKVLLCLMIIGSMVFTFVWTMNNGTLVITHLSDVAKWGNFINDVYVKPWARLPPYFLGLLFGIMHSEFENSKKHTQSQQNNNKTFTIKFYARLREVLQQRKFIRISLELFGVFFMLFLILIPRTLQVGDQWQQWQHSLYQSTGKFFFVLMLYWTLLPSLMGCKSSIVRFTMDTKFFNFIAKISFCTYLIHLTIIQIWINSRTYSQYFTNVQAFPQYCGLLIVSLFFGLVITFMIEIPCSNLQKNLMKFIKQKLTNNRHQFKQVSKQTVDTQNLFKQSLLTDENQQKQ